MDLRVQAMGYIGFVHLREYIEYIQLHKGNQQVAKKIFRLATI